MKINGTAPQRMIYNGQIDYYVPMQFVVDYDADTICRKIHNGFTLSINEYSELIQKTMEETLQQEGLFTVQSHKSSFSKWLSSLFQNTEKKKKDVTCNELKVVIDTTEKGVAVSVLPGQLVAYQERMQNLIKENEKCEKIYGSNFLQSHKKILLPPFAITLHNDEDVWLSAILYVFNNKMAVLKLELPIVNTPFSMLQELGTEHLIKEASPPWGMEALSEKPSLKTLWIAYWNTINGFVRLKGYQTKNGLRNIILTSFDDRPKYVQTISDDLLFDLYRIISAPVNVPNGNLALVKQKAREYMNTQFIGDIGIRYFFCIAGSCLSIVDESVQDDLKERMLKKNIELDDHAVNYVLTSSAYINIEFSLIILLLKSLNSTFSFNEKLMNQRGYAKAQSLFNGNRIFIAHMQEECYGSVSEQVALVEKLMPYYRKYDIELEKATAIDQIILEEKSRKNELFQQGATILGALLALVVGLPSIVDTLKILRPWMIFLPKDIPFMTIEGASCCLWVILVFTLFWVIKKRR